MTELTIRPEEIRDALERFVQSYTPDAAAATEVGVVAEAGDGIARVEGLPSAMTNELLQFDGGLLGIALNLDLREIGVVLLGEFSHIEEGQEVHRTGEILSVPVGDGFLGRVVDPLGAPIDGLGAIEAETRRAAGAAGPHRRRPPAREGGAADRCQGGRRDDADRARAAAADHRRPADRQDRDRDRHDHQPARELEVRRPEAPGQVRLRRHRPEGLDDRRRSAGPSRRPVRWSTRRSWRLRRRTRPASSTSPRSPGSAIGQHWMYKGEARPDRLRRPEQAGRGLPCGVVAAASPAGSRGVPR